jgi:hypothetical protein
MAGARPTGGPLKNVQQRIIEKQGEAACLWQQWLPTTDRQKRDRLCSGELFSVECAAISAG